MNKNFFHINKKIYPLKCEELFYLISGIMCITGAWHVLINIYFNKFLYDMGILHITKVIEPLLSLSVFLSTALTSLIFSVLFSFFVMHIKNNIKLNKITLYLSSVFVFSFGLLMIVNFDLNEYENIFEIYFIITILFVVILILLVSKNFIFNILFVYLIVFSSHIYSTVNNMKDKSKDYNSLVKFNIYTTYNYIYRGAEKIYIDNYNLLHFDNGEIHILLPINSVLRIESSIKDPSTKKGLKK